MLLFAVTATMPLGCATRRSMGLFLAGLNSHTADHQAIRREQYGDVLTISVRGGALLWRGNRYACEPVSFDLRRGESLPVEFRGAGEQSVSTNYRVHWSDDGSTLFFAEDSIHRTIIDVRSPELGETIESLRIRNDEGMTLEGSAIHLRYKDLPGAAKRSVSENR